MRRTCSTLRDLGEQPNATRYEIVDPGSRLGYGEENSVPSFLFERRLGLGPMQYSFGGREPNRDYSSYLNESASLVR
jgi:hypothetical protein